MFEIKDEAEQEGQRQETRRQGGDQDQHGRKEKDKGQASGFIQEPAKTVQPDSSTSSVGASITYAPTINVSVNVDGRRVSTSRKSPRRSHASSLESFELVSEDEDLWP